MIPISFQRSILQHVLQSLSKLLGNTCCNAIWSRIPPFHAISSSSEPSTLIVDSMASTSFSNEGWDYLDLPTLTCWVLWCSATSWNDTFGTFEFRAESSGQLLRLVVVDSLWATGSDSTSSSFLFSKMNDRQTSLTESKWVIVTLLRTRSLGN